MVIVQSSYILIVTCTEKCISIEHSYRIESSKDMKEVLNKIRDYYPDNYAIHKRSIKGMIREWRTHNLLYSLGIEKERTKTVDLEINQSVLHKILYALGSLLYFRF